MKPAELALAPIRPFPAPPLRGGAFRKYWRILKISLIERMVYRADFLIGTLLRFLPIVTTILLWDAIYAGSGKDKLAGFSRADMIAYLLLVHVGRMFSSMPGLAAGIARDIRDGTLKKYLLQPIHMVAYLVTYRAAHKAAYIVTSALPYAFVFWLCRSYFPGWPDGWTLAGYVVSLLLAFAIGFFFEAAIGMIGFWFLEVSSFLYVVNTIAFFISGQMFPLDLLPRFWVVLLKALPFQYLAYFPTIVILGKVQGTDLAWGLAGEAAWAAVLLAMSCWLYRRGLRRYSAFGG